MLTTLHGPADWPRVADFEKVSCAKNELLMESQPAPVVDLVGSMGRSTQEAEFSGGIHGRSDPD